MADYDCEREFLERKVDLLCSVFTLPSLTDDYRSYLFKTRLYLTYVTNCLSSSRYCTSKGSAKAPQFHIQSSIIGDE